MRLVRWWWTRRARLPASARVAAAVALGALAVVGLAAPAGGDGPSPDWQPGVQDHGVPRDELLAEGERLYAATCSDCHGADLRGIPGRAPSLRGVGELSADFYLRTGRMPMRTPGEQPERTQSQFTEREADAIIAYVGSFGGPGVPAVDPARGDLAEGMELFGEHCMGCHQVVGRGGITTSGVAPDLQASEPVDVAAAVRIGPYVMPRFEDLTPEQVDALAAYVDYTKDPEDVGGWGIGHIGPIPEGMVAWLLAGFALLLVIRLIGERTTE